MPSDTQAALEWQSWKNSLCPGCGEPKAESMASPPPGLTQREQGEWDDRYDVSVVHCAACAALGRKAWNIQKGRSENAPPPAGEFFIVRHGD